MRKTYDVDEEIDKRLKDYADREGRLFKWVVGRALELGLAELEKSRGTESEISPDEINQELSDASRKSRAPKNEDIPGERYVPLGE